MQSALIVTAVSGAEQSAAGLAKQLSLSVVDVAGSRNDALAFLRRREYSVVVIDEPMTDGGGQEGADLLWKHSGLAIPLQINFAISGTNRLIRDVRAALARREQEQALAMQAATVSLENQLRDAVTGVLLNAELALGEPNISEALTKRLETVASLARELRSRLEHATAAAETVAS